jgi:hypothetical protein
MPMHYHWRFAPVSVLNPPTFTEKHCDIILPPGHTLRRILVNTPLVYFKRGSVSADNQEMYFINYDVTYGYAEGAPFLYRSTRTLKEERVVNPTALSDVWVSFHSGADLELGFNEKVQRGGPTSDEQRLRLAWTIYSSGIGGSEVLAGDASIGLRALYSDMVPE